MNIEDLNKTQLVLLNLLVTFVTSIAASIVIVSLLDDQAPPTFSQTVNRVVERTVEKAVPVPGKPGVEKTVIVREEDVITKSIVSTRSAIVPIYSVIKNEEGKETEAFVARGTLLSSDGLLATHSGAVRDEGVYVFATEDGKKWKTKILHQNEKNGVALLAAVKSEEDSKYSFPYLTVADSRFLQLGQSVIAIGGGERKSIAVGTIENLNERAVESASTSTPPTSEIIGIETSALPKSEKGGGALLSGSGDFIGMAVPDALGVIEYLPSNVIKAEISSLSAKPSETKPKP